MGSRWKGSIEPGSMPALHQYFGTPVTTWILNRLYGSQFSDIHCGMRGITRDALERMDLSSQSWEYASEMVLKSVHMELRTTEVPVTFLKDREGRLSHHKRSGWFSPFQAAWINLRAMFVYGADFFLFKPGAVVLAIGLLLASRSVGARLDIGQFTLSLYWQFLGVVASWRSASRRSSSVHRARCCSTTPGGKSCLWIDGVHPDGTRGLGLVVTAPILAIPFVVTYSRTGSLDQANPSRRTTWPSRACSS